jgi:hypothetical protein
VQGPVGFHRKLGCLTGLTEHLAPVHTLDDGVPDGSSKKVFLEFFERQSSKKIVEGLAHQLKA